MNKNTHTCHNIIFDCTIIHFKYSTNFIKFHVKRNFEQKSVHFNVIQLIFHIYLNEHRIAKSFSDESNFLLLPL